MAEIIYYLDPAGGVDDGYTRTSWAGIQTDYTERFGTLDLTATGKQNSIKIRVCSNMSTPYNFNSSGWIANIDYNIEIYGWDKTLNQIDKTIELIMNQSYAMLIGVVIYTSVHDLTIKNTAGAPYGMIEANKGCKLYNLYCFSTDNRANGISTYNHRDQLVDWPEIFNCLTKGFNVGITAGGYSKSKIYNCTAIECETGFYCSSDGSSYIIKNCLSYGCTTTNWSTNLSYVLAGSCNNFGQTGNLIPGDNPRDTLTIEDFKDFANGDYHLSSTSRARHTHVDYPIGDNSTVGVTEDYDGDFPTGEDLRWDSGYDYYVEPVTGYIWKVRSSQIVNGAVTLLDTTEIEDVSNVATTSTLSAVSTGSDKDTLKIVGGVTALLNDYSQTFSKRGLAINIDDGEFAIENTSLTHGLQLYGWTEKEITVGALGKIRMSNDCANLCTVADLTAAVWVAFWSDSVDNLNKFPEPSVILIGETKETSQVYYNKGLITRAVANDVTHGRLFSFNNTTGAITFPNNQPTSTDNIFIFNSMIHSKDGQSTNAKSFGFNTFAGGKVEIDCTYHTGSANFSNASELKLNRFGIIQPLVIDNCQNVELDVYRSESVQNVISDKSVIKNLIGESALGSYRSINNQTGLEIYNLINCVFSNIEIWLHALQTGVNYPLVVGSSSGGSDNLNLGNVKTCGGGIQFTTTPSNAPTIESITHSNDCSGTNTSNLQHVIYIGSSGTRNLIIKSIALAPSGLPTQLDIVNMSSSGNFKITTINYNANIRNVGYFGNCFSGLLSGFVVGQISGQPFKFKSNCKDITTQNGYSTSTGTIAAFDYYQGKNIRYKNIPYQSSNEYLLSGWSNVPIPDMNFLEFNKFGSPHTGVLVQNFYRSSKNEFTFTGSAKSNQFDAVLLPVEDDSVVVVSPYKIKVGTSTNYFANIAPVLVGVNTGNLLVEYQLNVNNAGYGSWKTLNASNLSGESFTENDEFLISYRVICIDSGAGNLINQIVVSTLPDETVVYPINTYSLTVGPVDPLTEIRIMEHGTQNELTGIENVGSTGYFTYEYGYAGTPFFVDINILHATTYENRFIKNVELAGENKSILIEQTPDRWYKNP